MQDRSDLAHAHKGLENKEHNPLIQLCCEGAAVPTCILPGLR